MQFPKRSIISRWTKERNYWTSVFFILKLEKVQKKKKIITFFLTDNNLLFNYKTQSSVTAMHRKMPYKKAQKEKKKRKQKFSREEKFGR